LSELTKPGKTENIPRQETFHEKPTKQLETEPQLSIKKKLEDVLETPDDFIENKIIEIPPSE